MGHRFRNLTFHVLVALPATAALSLAGPLSGTAHANACQRYGAIAPMKLSPVQSRRAIRCLLNRERSSHGRSRLHKSRRLQKAAQRHTTYMTRHHCFSHECPGEPSVLARLQKVNYIVGGLARWSYGENIAWGGRGRGTPKAIVKAWMHSPEHRANILNPQFESIGVGFRSGCPGSRKADAGTYTTDFGMRNG
jgi:uncharacterized protein YkwD